ncbi:hypothetical protein CfE428DRAFT_6010 [Chthoniobacter flavus Ellin428]|uniref:Uncharacterized protein n=1 Tax=Chthoniobacter flavus Ellin428 TaxID=497964 RepID=B4DAR9_9BACT|nr:hypothetical protein CfE428DRAFT_6010 [Chthoniobacter flavus Ellin428]
MLNAFRPASEWSQANRDDGWFGHLDVWHGYPDIIADEAPAAEKRARLPLVQQTAHSRPRPDRRGNGHLLSLRRKHLFRQVDRCTSKPTSGRLLCGSGSLKESLRGTVKLRLKAPVVPIIRLYMEAAAFRALIHRSLPLRNDDWPNQSILLQNVSWHRTLHEAFDGGEHGVA